MASFTEAEIRDVLEEAGERAGPTRLLATELMHGLTVMQIENVSLALAEMVLEARRAHREDVSNFDGDAS